MSRKTVSGPIRDKDRTKEKLISAVGKLITTKGFHELRVTTIASTAGVDKKLIYEYYGSVENLVTAYLRNEDYGSNLRKMDLDVDLSDHGKLRSKLLIEKMYEEVTNNKELQKIIVWELYAYNEILRNLVDEREKLGEQVVKEIMEPYFEENHKKYRAVMAILISSTYYLNIHAESNGSLFCGLDVLNPEDRSVFLEVVNDIIDGAYEKYGKPSS